VNIVFRPFDSSEFDVFRKTVTSNPNLDRVIVWARALIVDTNTQAGPFERRDLRLESTRIASVELPEEVAALSQGVFDGKPGQGPPHVQVYRTLNHTETFIAVSYDYGRERSFGLTIGPTNFTIPTWLKKGYGLKHMEKCKEGVFVYETQ
jgi:hypothetical protein